MRGTPFPPPADFASRTLPLAKAGGIFYRCAVGTRPLLDWDARPTSRFSHPALPFPVLYLAADKLTGFWECFGDELNDQPQGQKALSLTHQLAPRRWIRFQIAPSLRVVDTTAPESLRELGADGATFLAEYATTQRWAEALMQHPAELDGFYYRSRLESDKRCLAVFGRPALRQTKTRLRARKDGSLLEDLDLLLLLAKEGVALL